MNIKFGRDLAVFGLPYGSRVARYASKPLRLLPDVVTYGWLRKGCIIMAHI